MGSKSGTLHMATTTLKVEGMTCGACTSSVEAAFKDVAGAGSVSAPLRYALGRDPIAIGKPKGTMLDCIRAK